MFPLVKYERRFQTKAPLHTVSTHMCVEANEHVCWLHIPFVDCMPHLADLFDFTLLFQLLKQVIGLRQAQAAEI
jgi:hypothetical protein